MGTLVLCDDATTRIGTFCNSDPHDGAVSQSVSCHHGRIESDRGDNLGHEMMILLPQIRVPRASIAMQEQWRAGVAALGRRSQPSCQLHSDRHRIAFEFFLAAVSATTFAGFRHHQFRPHGMILQVIDAQPDDLTWSCAGDRQHIDDQTEPVIEHIGIGNESAHFVVREDDVAWLLRTRQTGQSNLPCLSVLNAFIVVLRGQAPMPRQGNGKVD